MGAHAMGPAMVDRADVEVARFDVAEAHYTALLARATFAADATTKPWPFTERPPTRMTPAPWSASA